LVQVLAEQDSDQRGEGSIFHLGRLGCLVADAGRQLDNEPNLLLAGLLKHRRRLARPEDPDQHLRGGAGFYELRDSSRSAETEQRSAG
jgi:hypothetical protein